VKRLAREVGIATLLATGAVLLLVTTAGPPLISPMPPPFPSSYLPFFVPAQSAPAATPAVIITPAP